MKDPIRRTTAGQAVRDQYQAVSGVAAEVVEAAAADRTAIAEVRADSAPEDSRVLQTFHHRHPPAAVEPAAEPTTILTTNYLSLINLTQDCVKRK